MFGVLLSPSQGLPDFPVVLTQGLKWGSWGTRFYEGKLRLQDAASLAEKNRGVLKALGTDLGMQMR